MESGTSNISSSAVPASLLEFDRRVYAKEFRGLLGWGNTWFNKKIASGAIPPGRRDCDGGRSWWPASEVRETLARLNAAARTDAASVRNPTLAVLNAAARADRGAA